ncbi:MAG: TonB-dependent receptor [Deltaproteobacteria bacterium]|nr:TonB-dependent receptor [Deltaproteobacteria bacterium]NND30602.1 TonB-dependent receptor [Myxococcales bacterium]MBT8464876.1 TonB-dependent receptor [Deltaproteobacteria bacterium]MBT8480140.1 TonB-dependent receptor [Deltaproteobacteria bacterium]NNK08984.1 TonB-dependent receptor [Myxococcales bacterium]
MLLLRLALCTFCVAAAIAAPVAAQYGSTATVTRPIPATNSLDPTAAGTSVRVRNRIIAQTTDQLLLESAGTRVVSEGAVGSPFCVRLRGVACDQVAVMLGDVPISSPDTGSFDLSLVPLEAIEGFEVFRGGTPAWLNEGAIGGVLRLRPRVYEETEVGARLTGGSFGDWRANVFGAAASDKISFFGTAGGAGARNDYPYRDDNATLFDPSDDVERQRQNADFLEGFGFSNIRIETSESSHLNLVFLGLGRERGEPGLGATPALQARNKTTRLIGSASWLHEKDGKHPYRLQVMANYDYGRNRLSDALGELGRGGPRRTDDQTHTVFGRVAASVLAVPWLEVTTIGTARYQAYDPNNELSSARQPASDRLTAAGTLETRLFGDFGKLGLELRSSVRLAWTRIAIREVPLVGESPGESSKLLPTFRVAGAISPVEWLAFRGSISSGFKLPSLLQLFGNRTNVEGNPDLVQERSLAYDGAVTLRGNTKRVSGYASVGAFLTHLDDAIRFRRTSASTFKAENIGGARNRGVEVELRGGVTQHFLLQSEVTWTQAIDKANGNQLPVQPEWVAYVQPEVHSGTLSKRVSDIFGFFQLAYVGKAYEDPANLVEISARTVLAAGVGVLLFEGRLGLGFRVDDLIDVRGQDLVGYPLPGRRYSGRVSYRHAW